MLQPAAKAHRHRVRDHSDATAIRFTTDFDRVGGDSVTRRPADRFGLLWLILLSIGPMASRGTGDDSLSRTVQLHQRIDQATEAAAIGPLAAICNDADFVRRVYLDLTGVIPTPDQTRTFLADQANDKRAVLINDLLDTPAFSRHVAVQLNVLLLDRKADKYVDQRAWEAYLVDSIDRRKPLDQIYRELIYPDEIAEGVAPPRKFLVNRGVEPHALTRDVGRLLFGMDMQCAQCHNHPLVDDYYQADYYGLFAFLNRSSLFEDPTSKVGKLAEKADGEAPFESVFTGEGKKLTRPRLPKGSFVYSEPRLSEEEAYRIKPEKTQAAKPTYSRRETLAKMLADSVPFRRNLANRVWAMVMGRGLVHPNDFHYLDNPPVNPALLAMLSDELVATDFDLRHLVRQIMLSRTYQRACEPPAFETINLADIRFRLDAFVSQRQSITERLSPLRSSVRQAEDNWMAKVAHNDKLDAQWIAMEKPIADARKASQAAQVEMMKATESQQTLQRKLDTFQGVLQPTVAAHQKLSNEKRLADAVAILQKRNNELNGLIAKAASELQTKMQAADTTRQALEKLLDEAAKLDSGRIAESELKGLERAFLALQTELWDVDAQAKLLDAQAKQCEKILDHAALVDADPEKAAAVWNAVVDRWTLQGQVAALKPLTPEQLAASAMQATGFLVRSETAAKAAVEKTPPPELTAEGIPEDERSRIKTVAVQVELLNQLRGSVNQFVEQFGGLAGEEFQATVNQALFLGNSPVLNNWLSPADGTLVGKLKSIESGEAIADEVSLAVLSRPATLDEQREVQRLMAQQAQSPADRVAVLAELVWAVITSNEFRFNH